MESPFSGFPRISHTMFFKFTTILFLSFFCHRISYLCSDLPPAPVSASSPISASRFLTLIKQMCLQHNAHTSTLTSEVTNDFGNITHYNPPLAVLSPSSVASIACIVKLISEASSLPLTVAARGNGHSLRGQAQAPDGVIITMDSIQAPIIQVHAGELPYADVYAGQLWIDVLNETLKHGLSPRSWTDYLYLTVGGTLSNAGVSGQAFRYGPQINNVYQLEVVTGKGEVFICSEKQNADLFYAVLGGLGQFGIITRAKIPLQTAPKMVKLIRASYTDILTFCNDQEYLISLSSENSFDYIEGFVKISTTEPNRQGSITAGNLKGSNTGPIYILEVVKYFNPEDREHTNQIVKSLLSTLSYIPSTLDILEVSYVEFLDRVHTSEMKLRAEGLWEVPHPWLNLLIPRSKIQTFAEGVFGKIVQDSSSGPILFYPLNKSKWNNKTSAVTPDEDVFYQVSFLFSAAPSPKGQDVLEQFLNQNKRILDFCEAAQLGMKQYLPYYTTRPEWQAHFGPRWDVFQQRKLAYDPLAILAPSQRIFPRKAMPTSYEWTLA